MRLWILVLTGTALTICLSCTKGRSVAAGSEVKADQARSASELLLPGVGEPDEFFIRNPEFNPSWFAKFVLTPQQAANLEAELRKKDTVKIRRNTSPAAIVSWWTPKKGALEFTYMTTTNALINVIISPGRDKVEVFIWWSSP